MPTAPAAPERLRHVHRPYLYSAGPGLSLLGGDHGLALAGRCCPGGFPTPCTPTSASRPWKRRCGGSGGRRSSIPTRAASSPHRLHRRAEGPGINQHGRPGPVYGQRLRRAAMEKSEVRDVYLHAYASVPEARAGIGDWLNFYNEERLHQGARLPDAPADLRRAMPGAGDDRLRRTVPLPPLPSKIGKRGNAHLTGMVTIENRLCFEVTRPLPPRCQSHQHRSPRSR